MISTSVLLAAALVGIDTGWEPAPEGGVEYIIQVEPLLLRSLQEGELLKSEVPAHLGPIRRYRIQLGNGPLPRVDPPPPADEAADDPTGGADATDPPTRQEAGLPEDRYGEMPPRLPSRYDVPPAVEEDEEPTAAAQPKPFRPREAPAPLSESQAGIKQASAEKDVASASDQVRSSQPPTNPPSAVAEPKPWFPLVFSLLLLIASLAGNVYLAWIWLETRRRYQALANRQLAA